MKDKGRRDYTLNPTTHGPTNGVQFTPRIFCEHDLARLKPLGKRAADKLVLARAPLDLDQVVEEMISARKGGASRRRGKPGVPLAGAPECPYYEARLGALQAVEAACGRGESAVSDSIESIAAGKINRALLGAIDVLRGEEETFEEATKTFWLGRVPNSNAVKAGREAGFRAFASVIHELETLRKPHGNALAALADYPDIGRSEKSTPWAWWFIDNLAFTWYRLTETDPFQRGIRTHFERFVAAAYKSAAGRGDILSWGSQIKAAGDHGVQLPHFLEFKKELSALTYRVARAYAQLKSKE